MNTICSRCGKAFAGPGPCAACLLFSALEPAPPQDLTGERLGPGGRYEVLGVLGQGGMGVVYEVRDTVLARTVALKLLTEDLDSPGELLREARFVAGLESEHIVPVYEVGDDHGIAYFTMKRIQGATLTTPAKDPEHAARVALQIARAVVFAHAHGIMHRDLKPQNVLVEGSTGQVFVADFGIAASEGPEATAVIVRGGTLMYMAPEVLLSEGGVVSTAVDIWGVGAILYELLSGRPPFEASSREERLTRMAAGPPAPLAGAPPDLQAICLHCLECDPARRYPTAAALAADLDLFLRSEPVSVRPRGPLARAMRLTVRHPLVTALGALFVLAVGYTLITALALARTQQDAFRATDLAARRTADLTALQMDGFARVVEEAGRDPLVASAVGSPNARDPVDACKALVARHGAVPFDGWMLFDTNGVFLGRAPATVKDNRGRSYSFRDYFTGAKRLAAEGKPGAHVSRAYRSEGDGTFEVAVSVPIRDAAGQWIAVLVGTMPTGSAFGSVKPVEVDDDRLTTSIIALRGRERADGDALHDPIFLLHRKLGPGEALSASGEPETGSSADTGALVRLAPVRGTPFSVLVRFSYDGSLATRLGRVEILVAWMPVAALVAFAWGVYRRLTRRRAEEKRNFTLPR